MRDWSELLHQPVVKQVDLVAIELMGLCSRMLFHDAAADVVRYQFGEEHSERSAVLPWIALNLSTQISAGRLVFGRYQMLGNEDVGEIITVGVLPDGGTLTTGGWFPTALDAVAYATEQGASSVMVVSVRASVASHREYAALAAIDGVEMVDMTPALVAREAREAAGSDEIDVVMPILYWAQRGQ